MKETRIQFLDPEDSLEKGMATHSSILAWKMPWTEEPGRLQSQRTGHEWATKHIQHIQYPCMSLYVIKAELHSSCVPRDDPQLWWVLAVAQEELGCPDMLLAPLPQGTALPMVDHGLDHLSKGLNCSWFHFETLISTDNRTERRIQDCLATSPYVCASGAKEGSALFHSMGKCWQKGFCCFVHSHRYPLSLGSRGSHCLTVKNLRLSAFLRQWVHLLGSHSLSQHLDQGRWVVGDADRFPSLPGGMLYHGHCLELPVYDDNKKQRTFAQCY